MYGVRSYSHFCDANSAVQTTSDEKTSQSPDFACWRWMNWLRCSSADGGNSVALSVMFGYFALNASSVVFRKPVVSLPTQYVTEPLAFCMDAGSMTLAPSVWLPPPPVAAAPPPVLPS